MAKRRSSRKKSSSDSPWVKLLIIFIILALISIIAAYFIIAKIDNKPPALYENAINLENNNSETSNKVEKKNSTKAIMSTPLEGTWVSNYDGAMLTINGNSFTVEMPSVDASSKIKGSFSLEKTIATFVNTSGTKSCPNMEGHYNYSFKGEELMFNKIKDPCPERSERMTETWFKL